MKTIIHRSLVNIKTTSKFIQSLLRFKSIAHCVLILLVFFGANEGKAQTFTNGNIAVFVAGASANNTTGSIVELNTSTSSQTAVQTKTIATNLRFSGSASSTCYLSNSNDGTLLLFSGVSTSDTSSNTNTITTRFVGSYNNAGNYSTATTYTGTSGQQPRSAGTVDNSTYFIGDQGGFYTNNATIPGPAGNFRAVKAFGGTVYSCVASTSLPPVGTIASATGASYNPLTGLANGTASIQDYYLVSSAGNNTYDILYILSATSATAGTIAKYSLVSGSWTSNGSYTTSFGGFGLAAKKNGSGANLYVTTGTGATTANNVIKLNDTAGYNAAISITTANNVTLYTTATGTIIKGIAFAPSSPPTITGAATATAFTTTYGTASTSQTFTISGANLSANLVATAPTGFEVSADGTTYGSTATFSQSGGSATGTLRIRLASTAKVLGSYNNKTIVISSTGANSINITTAISGNTVSPKPLTLSGVSANDKIYDGTRAATFTASLNGVISPDVVTLNATGNFGNAYQTISIGTPAAVTPAFSISGADSSNYSLDTSSLSATYPANISPKALTISNPIANNKVYDGTTDAVISGTLVGVTPSNVDNLNAAPDVVSLGYVYDSASSHIYGETPSYGTFATANAGTNIVVTPHWFINGDTYNYTLTQPSVTLTANITSPSAPTINSAATASATYGVTATNYQITTDTLPSGVTISTYGATGLPAGLSVNTSTGLISGTPTAVGTFNVSLSVTNNLGSSGYLTLVYTVAPKALTLTNVAANNKEYDGTTAATVSATLNGVITGDTVTFTATGTFDNASVGNNIPVTFVSGSINSSNYSIDTSAIAGLTANITKRTLSFTASATNKVYDGTTSATVSVANLATVVGSEIVTLTATGTFADSNVGTAKAVTLVYTLGGANAANYQLPSSLPVVTADITAKPLTFTIVANNKEYDGTTTATVTISGITGFVGSDGSTVVINAVTPTFASPNVASGIAVSTTLTLSGTNSSNYSITQPSGLTATIFNALAAGDVAVIGYNTSGSPDTISLLVLSDLTSGMTFYVNDNELASASATSFTDLSEMEASFTVKAGQTVPAGTVLVLPWGAAAVSTTTYDWSSTSGSGLGNANEEVYIYTAPSITSIAPNQIIYYAQIGSSTSSVPSSLTLGTSAIHPLGAASRYSTTCATYNACKTTLLTEIGKTTTNWNTTGATTIAASDWTFTVPASCSTATMSASGTLSSLTSEYGSNSATTSFTINVSLLVAGSTVTVTAPSGFEVSTSSSSGFSNTITFTPCSTTNPTIYVQLANNNNVGNYSGTISISSTGASSTSIATNATNSVTPKPLTISGILIATKIEDGSTNGVITGTAVLNGVLPSDTANVTLVTSAASATFTQSTAGTNIPVTVAGYTLSGSAASNYSLTQPSGLTGTISNVATPVITSALSLSAVYGDAANYQITATSSVAYPVTGYNATNLPAGLSIDTTTGNISGSSTAVAGTYNIVISATNAGGTSSATLVFTITKRTLTVVVSAPSKTYDALTAATISVSTINNTAFTDTVTITGGGTYDTKNVGTGKTVTAALVLDATSATKYTLTQPTITNGVITTKALTLGSVVAQNKVYDGTTAATITATLTGVISPDVVTFSGSGTFATSAIGIGIAVTSTSTLNGTDAANYTFTQPTGLTANITDLVLYLNNFTGASACPTNGNVPTMATDATGTALTRSTITCNSTANVFNSTTLINTATINTASYIEFSASTSGGKKLNVTGLYFFRQASASAPNQLEVRYSTDNFATYTTWGTVPTTPTAGTGITWDFADFKTPIDGTVKFRLYPYGTSRADLTGASAPTGTFRVDDVTIYGSVVYGPSASNITTSGATTVCAGTATAIKATITGGLAPYTVVYSNGTSNTTVTNYTSGTDIAVTPSSTTTYSLVSVTDANGISSSNLTGTAIITVNANVTYYADADHDGYGNTAVTQSSCMGAPTGYVADNTDCDDTRATTNPGAVDICSDGIDNDCNGTIDNVGLPGGCAPIVSYVIPSQCGSNLSAIDTQIFAALIANAQGYRWKVTKMIAGSPSTNSADVQMLDTTLRAFRLTQLASYAYATSYQVEVAVKINNNWQPYYGTACTVTTPTPTTTLVNTQCGSTLNLIDDQVMANIVSFAQGYRWRITKMILGSPSTNSSDIQTIDTSLRAFKFTQLTTYAFATTYQVEVAVKVNNAWMANWGTACTITTPSPTTKVTTAQCGTTLSLMTDVVYANIVAYATGYRFQVTNIATSAVQTIDRTLREFRFNLLSNIPYSTQFKVEVAVRNTDGTYLPYGQSCNVTTPAFPTTSLQDSQCDYTAASNNELVYAKLVANATNYRFIFTNTELSYGYTFDTVLRMFALNTVPGLTPNTTYSVKVAVKIGGVWGNYSKVCTLRTPGTTTRPTTAITSESNFDATAYPNPFAANFKLNVTTTSAEALQVKVYDMLGKLIENSVIDPIEVRGYEVGNNYPSGVYNVIVSQGDNIKTLRVIKR